MSNNASSSQIKGVRGLAQSNPQLTYVVESTDNEREATAYLFTNTCKGAGYLLVSADDRLTPVLGYSQTASIADADAIPENMRWWLSEIGREADYALQNGISTSNAPNLNLGPAIEPMLTCQWGQGDPYNQQTPVISGQHAKTGCVATAMSQIMFYHKWSVKPEGSNSCRCDGNIYSMDFSELTFDWDNMTDRYDSNSSEQSKDAVSLLMKAAGYSVNTEYSLSASGAFSDLIPHAMRDHFKYNKFCCEINKNGKTFNDWVRMIYSNLSNGMPVLYTGKQGGSSGHAFVCDGYDGNGYFHFNWGWGGVYDGFFMLSCLNPSGIGKYADGNPGGYNFGQSIVLNMHPDNENKYDEYLFVQGSIHRWESPGIRFYVGIDARSGFDTVELGIGLRDVGSDKEEIVSVAEAEFGYVNSIKIDTYTLDKLDKNSVYEARLYWRKPGIAEDWAKMLAYSGGTTSGIIKCDDGAWTFNSRSLDLNYDEITLSDIAFNGISEANVWVIGGRNSIRFKARNNTDDYVYHNYRIELLESSSPYKKVFSMVGYVEMFPKEEKEWSRDFYYYKELKSGTYFLHVIEDTMDTIYSKTCYIEAKMKTDLESLEYSGFKYDILHDNALVLTGTASGTKTGGFIHIPKEFTVYNKTYKVVDIALDSWISLIDKNTVTELIIDYPIVNFGFTDLIGAPLLNKVKLPDSLTSLGDEVFRYCRSLEELILSKSLLSIGSCAFLYCKSLKNIDLPMGLRTIGDYAFSDCSGCRGILAIPNSVTQVGEYAFKGCYGFTCDLTIPYSVKLIGKQAFINCYGLGDVKCEAVEPPVIDGNAFDDSYYNKATLYVPLESIEKYKTANDWSRFASIKSIEDSGVRDIKLDNKDVNVAVSNGAIIIRGLEEGKAVIVYDMGGKQVYNGNDHIISTLGRGVYVVSAGNKRFKIVL